MPRVHRAPVQGPSRPARPRSHRSTRIPGKRPIFASTFYPALKKPNVELVPKAVASVTPTGIVDADGVEHDVDVIVMATGFQPANYLARLAVVGRGGRTLHEHWAGEPRAYLGITVPGFPNFFMLYGPGTNGGEIVHDARERRRSTRCVRSSACIARARHRGRGASRASKRAGTAGSSRRWPAPRGR